MRKVKTFREDRYEIEGAIETWLKANTNAYIASVVLSGNTTSIGNADSSNGASLIATNINNNVTL